ncbi:helix-turn-helix domain-containing protein [Kaistia nematophila]|uniref:Helix-turn-helix domain-containing protein n=1 Tax=Kaistia nematophila TaxID=2994654 RepID=A0A9X3E8J5_9HYPH|nr:helix-turn-helix domain-containing protein [Kaistia nematophila]MCX5571468.1 helix-turn-helix domain-containing protein [Kaistia nematophila]
MSPHLSIIPAAAVVDGRLEGRDLQVLALLGIHTDREGWCTRSQVRMARELGCGRATVQRSLGRLIEAGYVQQRALFRKDGGDRSHEYRVLLDEVRPAEFITEVDASAEADEQAGSAADPLPTGGQGCPPSMGTGVPAHGWAPNRTTLSSNDSERETRAARRDPAQEKRDALAAAEADEPFITWFRSWPTSASDSILRTHAAWLGLTEAERTEAVRCSEAAVANHTISLRRKGCYSATTYLEEKRWKMLPEGVSAKAGGVSSVTLAPRTLPWFAMFWRLVTAGKPVKVMFENMQRGAGYAVRLSDVPSDAETGALVKIEAAVDGRPTPEMAAWAAAMARHGISFTPLSIGMPFVWVPSRWPPGQEQAQEQAQARAG